MTSKLVCLNAPSHFCKGVVRVRKIPYPRCDFHWKERRSMVITPTTNFLPLKGELEYNG